MKKTRGLNGEGMKKKERAFRHFGPGVSLLSFLPYLLLVLLLLVLKRRVGRKRETSPGNLLPVTQGEGVLHLPHGTRRDEDLGKSNRRAEIEDLHGKWMRGETRGRR